MARLLAYTAPASGHVFPATELLLELHRRGHEVHVRTRASDVSRLEQLGLHAAPVDPRIEANELDDWKASNPIGALQRLQRWYEANAKVEVGDLREAIDHVRPEALIVDANLQGGAATAEASGLPWCQYSPFPPVFRSKDAPPYGPGLAPARGPLGHGRDRALHAILGRLADHYLPPVNALRAGLGLEPLRHLEDIFLRSRRFIVFTAEPLEYPRSDWPASVRLVGPLSWEPAATPPAWLDAETRPVVLVTASTVYQRDDKLIATALEALAEEPVAVVATTGALDPTTFAAPANAHVEAFLPHSPILERAACVVSHGGMGITLKALAAGVPVCVVPFCRDQFEVARRVETSRAGTRLHHKRLTPGRLRDAVRATIPMRDGAQRVAEAFAQAGGARAAADAVEAAARDRVAKGVASRSMAITDHLFRTVLKTHQALYERTDGRIGENLFGTKALLLRTKGRKSGQVRTAALTFAKDGDRYLIVASKGGAPEPPAWFLNLRADPHPEVQVGRGRWPATVTVLESDDPDYARVWKLVNDANSQRYDAYQSKTSRPIPVVALTRAG